MAEEVAEIFVVVLLSGKTDNALLVHVDLEWSGLGNGHIQAHIPLVAVYQVRI